MEAPLHPGPPPNLTLSAADVDQLRTTARWARLIAIMGFIMLGVMLLFGFLYGAFLNRVMSMAALSGSAAPIPFPTSFLTVFMVVIFLICAAIYFFPLMYLYRFAVRMQRALDAGDRAALSAALDNQRSLYLYIGVLMIIGLAMYALMLLVMTGAYFFMGSMADQAMRGLNV